MKEAIKKVNLRHVGEYNPKMKKVADTRDKYEVELELADTPDNFWVALFKDELKKSLPEGHLENSRNDPHLNDKSITFFTSLSKIEYDSKLIAKLVDSVNERVKQEDIRIVEENKDEKKEEEIEEDVMRQMRDVLKKII
jgi:hypothetical protein